MSGTEDYHEREEREHSDDEEIVEVEESKGSGKEGKVVASAADGKSKSMNARQSLADKARLKLRRGWKNDEAALNQYFQSCVASWKIYKGERKAKQVMKLQSIYRQAMFGDNSTAMPQNLKSVNGLKWQAWMALKGMPQAMAKRRFITYLAEINPALIDVMPEEKPPDGFCRDSKGELICAKANTVAGCSRPLLDQYKIDLRDQLYDTDELHEPQPLRKWVSNALANQRCVWGVHKMVPKADIKPFADWFNKDENGGYKAYESEHVFSIIRELLTYHFEIGYDMQCNLSEYAAEVFNAQVVKVGKLKGIYEDLSGEKYSFEAPCRQNTQLCNELRAAENGRNHTHPVDLQSPTATDVDDYDSSIELRKQCQKLGLKQSTGVVENVQERCRIYRERIADYFQGLKIAGEANMRLNRRIEEHKKEKKDIGSLGRDMIQRQASEACHSMKIDHVLTLIRRGCNPNVETNRGLTPMITAVLTQAPTELIEELITRKTNIDAVNAYGLTPLMLACRMKDTKMIHALMRLGASALQDGGRSTGSRTAMHWCAIHGSEEEGKIIMDYVKEGGGDSLRMSRVLDAQDEEGNTPLMLAARIRNGLMCRALSSMGANPNLRNEQNRNGCMIARTAGWTELADWLEKKVGAGVAKLETYSDQQYDNMVRYGRIRCQENIEEFTRLYVSLVYHSTATCPLGPPNTAQTAVQDVGKRAYDAQLDLADSHGKYIHLRAENGYDYVIKDEAALTTLETMRKLLDSDMLTAIQAGKAGPNTEALAKPLPWTPLMCATALNNVRTVRLLVRDGADPNHPNMHGTTPLMLAAQLHNLNVLVELLVLGAELSRVDNYGYTALAYANSLPAPQYLDRDPMNFIMEAETDAPKQRDAAAVIKLALKNDIGVVKEKLSESAEEASQLAVANHFRFMRLLESYGLSKLQNVKQLGVCLDKMDDRIGLDDHVKIEAEEFSETSSEMRERETVEAHRAEEAKHKDDSDDEDANLRCPICTLTVPCPHFFKAATLKSFFEKNAPAEQEGSGSALQNMLNAAAMRKKFAAENKERARMKVLTEVGIEDRNSDRSIAFWNKYRQRERELDSLARARVEDAEKQQLLLQQAEDAMEQGMGWEQKTEGEGMTKAVYYEHQVTSVRWNAVPDGQGQTYYFNPATNETLWDVPGLAEWLVKFKQDEADAEEKRKFMEDAAAAKEARRAARDAKKAAKSEKGKGKGNKKSKEKTGAELAAEAVEKAKALKRDEDYAKRHETRAAIERAISDAAFNESKHVHLGGEEKGNRYETDGFVTPTKRSKKDDGKEEDEEVEVQHKEVAMRSSNGSVRTPVSILKKTSSTNKKSTAKRNISFIEGDICPYEEVIREWKENPDGTFSLVTDGVVGEEPELKRMLAIENAAQAGADSEASGGEDSDSSSRPSSPKEVTKGEAMALKMTLKDHEGELSPDILKGLNIADGREAEHGELADGVLGILATEIGFAKETQKNVKGDGSLKDEDENDNEDKKSSSSAATIVEADGNRELTKDEKFRLRKGVNPFPPDQRRLMSFTREPLDAVNHLLKKERALTPVEKKRMLRDNTSKSSLGALWAPDPETGNLAPSYDVRAKAKRRTSAPKALMREEARVSLSGWVFVSLSTPDIMPPIEKVDLPLEMWSAMIEHLRVTFDAEWTPRLRMRSMVSPNTLKLMTPRCSACKVGFVRTKPNPKDPEDKNDLCFACIVRRELYTRAQQVFPRSFRRKLMAQWPFRSQAEVEALEKAEQQQLSLVIAGSTSPLVQVNSTLDVGSPIHSAHLAEMDVRETAFDMTRDGDTLSLGSVGSDGGDLIMGNITMGVTGDGLLKSVNLGGEAGKLIELDMGSVTSDSDSLSSSVTMPDIYGKSSNTMTGTGGSPKKAKIGSKKERAAEEKKEAEEAAAMNKLPAELSLLPFLLAKGSYEDVDRTVRVAVAQKNVDEGGGALFLVNAMALQADMYKLMGLYSLALATYLECFDLTVSILGFNSTPSQNAMSWVTSCLVKMRCPALSKQYAEGVCRSLEQDSLSENMFTQSKLLVDIDRAMRKQLVKNEMVWKNRIVPIMREREADELWNHPSRNHKWVLFHLCSYPAVYRLFASTDGFSVVARQSFEAHMVAVDPMRLGKYAQFVSLCFQLRMVNNLDTYRHLANQIIQKFLAKSLVDTCEVAKVYRSITPEEHLTAVNNFLHFGLPVEVPAFDDILFHSLKVLGNCGEYLFFYMRDGAAGLRERNPEDTLQCFNAVATKIQIYARMKLARMRCTKIRNNNEEEKARKLAEYNEQMGICEETEEEIKARKKAEKKAAKKKRQQELMDMGLSLDED